MTGYDAWATRDPWSGHTELPLPGDPWYPTCADCRAFLKRDPDKVEYGELIEECNGLPGELGGCARTTCPGEPHGFVAYAWTEHIRLCTRCGHVNKEVLP